ncbi:MAG: hypothetical protein R2883_06670 [Caldisericia bacterium]
MSLFATLNSIKNKFLKDSWKILLVSSIVIVPLIYLIKRTMAAVVGNGWAGNTAWQAWNEMFGIIIKGGIPEIVKLGESTVFFSAMYSSIQMFIVLSVQILFSGFISWIIYQIIRKKKTFRESFTDWVKPCFRFLWGMWVTLSPILLAGLVGTIGQILLSSQGVSATFSPWAIVSSAVVIGLVFIFLRISFLPYVRLESSERFRDSIKYSVHISSGNITLILVVLTPVILLSMVITYFTDSIHFVKTVASIIGIFLVTVVETALFLSLTDKKQKPGTPENKELLG